jgi:hypothetical protein
MTVAVALAVGFVAGQAFVWAAWWHSQKTRP